MRTGGAGDPAPPVSRPSRVRAESAGGRTRPRFVPPTWLESPCVAAAPGASAPTPCEFCRGIALFALPGACALRFAFVLPLARPLELTAPVEAGKSRFSDWYSSASVETLFF